MIVSKHNGRIDVKILEQHLREMPDGDYFVQLRHLNSPTKRMLGYFMGHICVLYKSYLDSCGVYVDKNTAANYLKESVGFGEPKIDFELDLGLTEREWQDLIERSFHKLLELGCKPVLPSER